MFVNCFIRQIIPDHLHCFRHSTEQCFRLRIQLVGCLEHGSTHVIVLTGLNHAG